ncbi:MAG: leucine-rich repeat domain-containing protein, partial [Prevotella sp.]|nr:leucine-rich repeat domain-containing protein [Prevotella sp.]
EDCSSLVKTNIPSAMVKIPSEMFKNCTSLEAIEIPASIKEISSNAFRGCSNLKEIELPTGLKEIGGNAFADCVNLKKVKSNGASPAKMSSSSFDKSTTLEGTLIVRKQSVKNYELDKQWCKFLNVSVF